MQLKCENDFQQKIMVQSFAEPFVIASVKDVNTWRAAWTQELKTWHSPYKVIVDCRELSVQDRPEIQEAMARMLKFFEGLFLKSITGFGFDASKGHQFLPWKMHGTLEEAQTEAGARGLRAPGQAVDFRGAIQFQNHFAQHVIEMSFSEPVIIDSKDKVLTLKSKLTNNLMQWHSKWSLLVDCTNLSMTPEISAEWDTLSKFMRGFFMKTCVGYSPRGPKAQYPFETYRARHKAVAQLENEGNFMGNDAQCRSKGPQTK